MRSRVLDMPDARLRDVNTLNFLIGSRFAAETPSESRRTRSTSSRSPFLKMSRHGLAASSNDVDARAWRANKARGMGQSPSCRHQAIKFMAELTDDPVLIRWRLSNEVGVGSAVDMPGDSSAGSDKS